MQYASLVENFLYEVSENIWLDFSCLILSGRSKHEKKPN